MNEPNQTHVSKLLRRKSSFDDYQRRLVDKIKRHFERRRKQWENNIENQVQHRQSKDKVSSNAAATTTTTTTTAQHQQQALEERAEENEDDGGERVYINIDSASEARLHSEKETSTTTTSVSTAPSARNTTSPRSSDNKCQQITIMSTETTDFPDEAKTKYTFIVDMKSFLPFGSVTVCQEEMGLMLIGESDCSGGRSRGRRGMARTYEKYIEIGGALDNDTMRVHTTREGIMRIDVVAANSEKAPKL